MILYAETPRTLWARREKAGRDNELLCHPPRYCCCATAAAVVVQVHLYAYMSKYTKIASKRSLAQLESETAHNRGAFVNLNPSLKLAIAAVENGKRERQRERKGLGELTTSGGNLEVDRATRKKIVDCRWITSGRCTRALLRRVKRRICKLVLPQILLNSSSKSRIGVTKSSMEAAQKNASTLISI